MSQSAQPRRVIAEIGEGGGQPAVLRVGRHSIHRYWPRLAPHFRDVLLPPQRRSDGGGVAWHWQEPEPSPPVSVAELAELRRRLSAGNEAWCKSAEEAAEDEPTDEFQDELSDQVEAAVARLVSASDAELAAFACRTEMGVRLHSWGAERAATPHWPEGGKHDVSGKVLLGSEPCAEYAVLLENKMGLPVARTTTDETGAFSFSKVASGEYRVRVISGRARFSVKGTAVTVGNAPVANLEIQSLSAPETEKVPVPPSPAVAAENAALTRNEAPPRRGRTWRWVALVSVLGLAGVFFSRCVAKPRPPGLSSPSPTKETAKSSATQPPPSAARPESIAAPAPVSAFEPGAAVATAKANGLARFDAHFSTPSETFASRSGAPPRPQAGLSDAAVATGGAGESGLGVDAPSGENSNGDRLDRASRTAAPTPDQVSINQRQKKEPPADGLLSALKGSPAESTPTPDPVAPTSPDGSPNAAKAPTPSAAKNPNHSPAPSSPHSSSADSTTGSDETRASLPTSSDASGAGGRDRSSLSDAVSPTGRPTSPANDRKANRRVTQSATLAPRRNPAASSTTDTTSESERGTVSEDKIQTSDDVFAYRQMVHASEAKVELIGDWIVPTRPMKVGEDDAAEATRARMMAEKQASLPGLFVQPKVQHGFLFVFAASSAEWKSASESTAVNCSATADRGEIAWGATAKLSTAKYVLRATDGRVLAQVSFEPGGEARVLAAAGVRPFFWVGIEPSKTGESSNSRFVQSLDQFEWRRVRGSLSTAGWVRDALWAEGHGLRLQIPLELNPAQKAGAEVALVDRVSGWSLVQQVEFSAAP